MTPLDAPGSAADQARLIHEALAELGPGADLEQVVQQYRHFDRGLPAEDQFAVILGWLGRCTLVHKLDQRHSPANAHAGFVVPDLLTLMEHEGRVIPLLVEVKTTIAPRLSWSARYYERLRRYGQSLGLPVVIAWRYRGIWTMFDLAAFRRARTNYKIDLSAAHQANLMGVLAGDFVYVIGKGVGFHFTLRREELLEERDGQQMWKAGVEDAYFTDANNQRRTDLDSALFWLFAAANPSDKSDGVDDHVTQSFVMEDESGTQWGIERSSPCYNSRLEKTDA